MKEEFIEMNINTNELKHLSFNRKEGQYIVSLLDSDKYAVLRGYGKTPTEAINDLHAGLL
ncbi:hypothetical protein J8L85_09025 [Maribacter sp. MMG018]|uniref:hypothetical protein n=1 Tax=Maribacter sp. MMG018 TaxID=2822688 RepID=UPI001B38E8F4|nr:hypothetical protein [Maribacter sp. MMG018]MBQ4914574.1 hypothetical protein [Maribacter sp. MMG018]